MPTEVQAIVCRAPAQSSLMEAVKCCFAVKMVPSLSPPYLQFQAQCVIVIHATQQFTRFLSATELFPPNKGINI